MPPPKNYVAKYKLLIPFLLAAHDAEFGICLHTSSPGSFATDFANAKRMSKIPELDIINFRPSPEVPGEFWIYNTEKVIIPKGTTDDNSGDIPRPA